MIRLIIFLSTWEEINAIQKILLTTKVVNRLKSLSGTTLRSKVKELGWVYKISADHQDVLNPTDKTKRYEFAYSDYLQLYMADLNNDGKDEYILTYIWSDSMGASGLVDVFHLKKEH